MQCPNCKREIFDNATFCRYCGLKTYNSVNNTNISKTTTQRNCPYCKSMISPNANQCSICHTKLTPQAPAQTTTTQVPTKKKCLNCNSLIGLKESFCPICGTTEFVAATTAQGYRPSSSYLNQTTTATTNKVVYTNGRNAVFMASTILLLLVVLVCMFAVPMFKVSSTTGSISGSHYNTSDSTQYVWLLNCGPLAATIILVVVAIPFGMVAAISDSNRIICASISGTLIVLTSIILFIAGFNGISVNVSSNSSSSTVTTVSPSELMYVFDFLTFGYATDIIFYNTRK